ncbi:MAG TPA: hypothetical protein VFB66_26680 [Tepidisphaeraceae bacterium]|nr:hypothetical protein [Tepidisphaeraceae bacterium]
MVAAIRQQVTVKADGVIEVRSPDLRAGDRAEVIVLVEQPLKRPATADPQSWDRLLRHMGAVDSGDPHAADNERIDTDLAREYGNGNGDEGTRR